MKKMETFNVLFIAREKRNSKSNLLRLYARVTVAKARAEVSLGLDISDGLFDVKAQRCLRSTKEAKSVNDFINTIRFKFDEYRKQLMYEDIEVTPDALKRMYMGVPLEHEEQIPTLFKIYEEHNARQKELIGIDIAAATYTRHETSYQHVKTFVDVHYNKKDIDIEDVNFKFLNDYAHYLKTVRKCNHNTTMKYIKNFGKVIRLAIAEGYITKNPFDKFKMSYKPVHREVLTEKEIKKLVEIELPEERLDRVRDLFVFCIYTGLAFIDVSNLKMENLTKGKDGKLWIKNRRMKTSVEYMIPIMLIPKKLIEKYADTPNRSIYGEVLPTLSNQKYNSYLKELAIRVGIKKNLTSHLARHTFATTICMAHDVPIAVISSLLGHSDIKTTQIYAKVSEQAILNGMKGVID